MDDEPDAAALLDDARAQRAAAARSRERWLREQAAAGATFAGTLLDLCERGVRVAVRTTTGGLHRGVIRAVGDGVVVLAGSRAAPVVYVRIAAIAAVRPAVLGATSPLPAGDRRPPAAFDLATLLGDAAADRPRVTLVPDTGEPFVGELRSVGLDIATIVPDGPDGGACHVHLAAITEARIHHRAPSR